MQGDLKGAEAAFLRVTEMAPKNPDGWVNIGRVRVQEGNVAGAREVLEKALQLAPDLARAQYFFSRVLKSEGKLEESAAYLARCWRNTRRIAWRATTSGAAVPAAALRGRSRSSRRRSRSIPRT